MIDYKIIVTRKGKYLIGGNLEMGGIGVDFETEDENAVTSTAISNTGYRIIIAMLSEAISSVSEVAEEQGINRGKLIGDAIKQLENNLIDIDRINP